MMSTNTKYDFQTPEWGCKYMVDLLNHENIKKILEPTKGQGNIVKEIEKRKCFEVIAPEDFFDFQHGRYDAVVMNPPFTPMKMGYEILYKCMDLADVVIALMPWLTIINSSKRTRDIMDFGLVSITHLPRNAFKGSRVQTCVLNMNKGYEGETKFLAIEQGYGNGYRKLGDIASVAQW